MPFFTTALGHAADIPPVDMGYHYPGVVRFVDAGQILSAGEQTGQSWTTAYKYLQDALDEAAVTPITSICVAEGTYYPDEDKNGGHMPDVRSETFRLVTGTGLYGGFTSSESLYQQRNIQDHRVILSGGIVPGGERALDSYNVVTGNNDSAIDCVWIELGNANDITPGTFRFNGGGFFARSVSNIVITNCIFNNNIAKTYGGGVYFEPVYEEGGLVVVGCVFVNNAAYQYMGGGIYIGGEKPCVLQDSLFTWNYSYSNGGALAMTNNASIVRCRFIRNYIQTDIPSSTTGGGAISNCGGLQVTTPKLDNCLFVANSSRTSNGGAILNYIGSSPVITNCTFINNYQYNSPPYQSNGSAIYNYESCFPVIYNSVFWDSKLPEIRDAGSPPSSSSVYHSDVQGRWYGNGSNNIYSLPEFLPTINSQWTASETVNEDMGQTVLYDSNNSWNENELVGKFVVNPNNTPLVAYPILSNTTSTITVWGTCGFPYPGEPYQIIDYRLSSISPCIDTGDPLLDYSTMFFDIDKRMRIVNGTIDMGCSEYGAN